MARLVRLQSAQRRVRYSTRKRHSAIDARLEGVEATRVKAERVRYFVGRDACQQSRHRSAVGDLRYRRALPSAR